MSWLLFAILGHAANGIAFIIDKALLSTAFKRSATYAGLICILSFLVVLAAPWVTHWPTGTTAFVAIASGVTFTLGLWAFFAALARAEASRVVPIAGSLIPMLTLLGSFVFLNERLSQPQLLGFAFLVVATVILSSSGGKARPPANAIGFVLLSSVLFGIASVSAKFSYDALGFLSGFISNRLAAAATAVVVVTLLDSAAGSELWSIVRPKKGKGSKLTKNAGILAVIGQATGSAGFLLVQYAVSMGSASIVNALQAVQYALLVLAAFALRHRAPKLLGENLAPKVVAIKTFALILTAIGLALIL
ncbi:MAG: EamA family transporter [Patescibacteria group bacterium]|jgi:drug/metabolite transporter (DMT)-like permease